MGVSTQEAATAMRVMTRIQKDWVKQGHLLYRACRRTPAADCVTYRCLRPESLIIH
jgi:hypothetical protein